jgi:hypothetical protein
MTLVGLAAQLPPGPTDFPNRDVFWLGAIGIVLLVVGVALVVSVRRLRRRAETFAENPAEEP